MRDKRGDENGASLGSCFRSYDDTIISDSSILSPLANALGGQGLIRSKVIQIQPNEIVLLGGQCDCVLVHADTRYFNGNKMVSVDTNGMHVVFNESSQGGFDSYLRFFGSNEVWVENISSYTLKIGAISFFEGV